MKLGIPTKGKTMTTLKDRAIQIVNQMQAARNLLGASFTRDEHEAERKAFWKGCQELAQMDDPDAQDLAAFLLNQNKALNLHKCKGWMRIQERN